MINVCAGRPQKQAALYDAQDSDDPKAAIVELILQVRITHSRRPNAVLTRMNVHRMLRAPTRRRHSARSCRRCGWAACASGRRRRAWGTTNCAMLRCAAHDRQFSCRGCVPSLSKGCGQDEEDPKAAVIELILRGARAA